MRWEKTLKAAFFNARRKLGSAVLESGLHIVFACANTVSSGPLPKEESMQTDWGQEYLELLKKSLTASLYDESAYSAVAGPQVVDERLGASGRVVAAGKRAVVRFLRRKSLMLVRMRPYQDYKRDEGHDWPLFGYTMVGHLRLDNVRMCVETIIKDRIAGDFVETGVWRGGTVIWMRALLKFHGVENREVWAADSFEGLPKPQHPEDMAPGEYDLSNVDSLAVSVEEVKRNFTKFSLLNGHVHFLKGWFKDTLPSAPIEKIALLRLDGDLYESTMDSLTSLYDRVTPGGFIIVDDYGSWPPCKAAVDEFLTKNRITVELKKIDYSGVYFQKP